VSSSRRDFLKRASALTALGVLQQLPGRALWAEPAGVFLPEPDEALQRRLALMALETARAAGAGFAAVRVSASRGFGSGFKWPQRPAGIAAALHFRADYGIRALVDGAWGFSRGTTLTPDAVAEVTRTAVARAKANRPRRRRELALAPAPKVPDGRWAPAIAEDPFAVPVRDQVELARIAVTAAAGVRGVVELDVGMQWLDLLHVFASSEGSLIVQRIPWARLNGAAQGRSREDHEFRRESLASLPGSGWYGYEVVRRADLGTELREAAERAVAGSKPPEPFPELVSAEVGRYDLVLGAPALVSVLRETLVPALNLERALGYHANRAGTSFAAPPNDILGKYQAASPLVTLRADRTTPHAPTTVGWDDEGIPAAEWTLIEEGVIVDYLTSRQTAAELAPSYEARGEPVRSRGCTVVGDKGREQQRPQVGIPRITLLPAKEDVAVEDLIADTKRGFYIPSCSGGSDQQLLSGQFKANVGEMREIRNGKLGPYIKDLAFQFLTPQFWKGVDALGGPKTVEQSGNYHVPAALVRQVNVLNTGRTQ
jgi:TldD protein